MDTWIYGLHRAIPVQARTALLLLRRIRRVKGIAGRTEDDEKQRISSRALGTGRLESGRSLNYDGLRCS
jgi:hypothetical protein